MKIAAAILFAVALAVGQAMHGGAQVPGLMVPALVLAFAAALLTLPGAFRQPPAPAPLLAVMLFLGYIIWRCLQPGVDPFLSRLDLTSALLAGVVFVAVSSGFSDPNSRLWLLGSIALVLMVQMGIGLIQFTRGGDWVPLGWFSEELHRLYMDRFAARTRGSFLNPNQFAWAMATGFLVAASLAVWGRLWMWARILCVYFAAVFLAGLILSASRGGLIAVTVGILAFGLVSLLGTALMSRQGNRTLWIGSFLVLVVIVGSGALVYNFTWVAQSRFQEIMVPGVRASYVEIALRDFQTSPVFGTGPGNFLYAARQYRHESSPGDAMYAHNDWLQLLAEYGWIGFSLGLIALLLLLRNGVSRFLATIRHRIDEGRRPLSNEAAIAAGTLAVAVLYTVHSLVDFNFHVPANLLLAAIVLGLLAAGPRSMPGAIVPPSQRWIARVLVIVGWLGFGGGLAWQLVQFGRSDLDVLKARNALMSGESAIAYSLASEALKEYPNDPQWWMTKAQAARGYETDEILKLMQRTPSTALPFGGGEELDPMTLDALAQEGPIPEGFDEGKRAELMDASMVAYRKSIALRPEERQFRAELADLLAAQGDLEGMRTEAIQSIELDPWSGYGHAKLGESLDALGFRLEAMEIFRIASPLAHGAAARAAVDRIRGDEALERELQQLEMQAE